MIENEQQFHITREALARFEASLEQGASGAAERHPLVQKAIEDSIRSEIEVLHSQLADYKRLRSGSYAVIELDSLLDLPALLIRARPSQGMSRQTLARHLGVDEERIAGFEETEYAGATLAQIQAAVEALGLSIHERVLFPVPATERQAPVRID